MKKLLFLLLMSVSIYGQTYQNPTFGTVTTKTSPTVTNDPYLTTTGATGIQGKIAPVNVLIPYTPINYTISGQTIGQQIAAIDAKIGTMGTTSAGVTQRVDFTADNTVVNAVTYFASSLSGKGSTASGSPPALVLPDNTKAFFTKDVISIAQPSPTIGYAGVYSGNLTVSASPTPVATKQRFTVEIYRTDNLGNPIASGVSGAIVGDLGVTVLAILDSGELNLTAGSITNIPVSGRLTQNVTINTGERLRYHVSAAKIGTGGGNVTFGVYYGNSYNSYYDIPVAITTDAVLNKSTVTPAITDTDALNALNTGKANLLGGNTFTGDQNLSSVNGNGRIGLLAITNNIAGTYNQPFYQSDFGYSIFRPYGTNLAQRFYLIPNGTPTGATSKLEMFNTDYYANAVTYAGLNVFTENTNNRINYGSNRGSGGGTRMGMLFYGDYVGSNSGAQNANSIQFYTNNDLALNEWAGAIGFGTATTDPFALSVANQFTFKNSAATATRVNIVGNGTTAGLYFGRDAIRTIALESVLTTSDLRLSLNSTNSGSALTAYGMVYAATGNMILQNGGTFTDTGERLKVVGTISATTYTGGAALTNAPTAPTATAGTNTTQIATTAFVQAAIGTSGTYTPTLTNTSNISSSSLQDAVYTKIGNIVTVRVGYQLTPTTGGTSTTLTITLPINRVSTTATNVGSGVISQGSSITSSLVQLPSANSTQAVILSIPPTNALLAGVISFTYSIN